MKFSWIIISIFLAGCSGIVFDTNVRPYIEGKAEDTIRAGVVSEYKESEIWHLNASVVGYVDAEYCQANRTDQKPSQSYLMTKLKIDAQRLGGNGIVFNACGLQTTSARCYVYLTCTGTAYLVAN